MHGFKQYKNDVKQRHYWGHSMKCDILDILNKYAEYRIEYLTCLFR